MIFEGRASSTYIVIYKKIYRKYPNYKISFKIASDFEFMLRIFGIFKVQSKYLNKNIITMRTGGVSTKSLKISFYLILRS